MTAPSFLFGEGGYLQSPKAFLNTLTPQEARENSAVEPTRDAAECKLPGAARAQHTTYSLLKGESCLFAKGQQLPLRDHQETTEQEREIGLSF